MPPSIALRSAARPPDAVCAAAVDTARAAAATVTAAPLGERVAVEADGERLVTHYFAANEPGYAGWRWAVTVARAPRAKDVTVCEMSLLPGPDALLAPEWLPWSERLRPGDLGVGDMLPTAIDDDRLVPGYVASDDPLVEEVAAEVDLLRPRAMSRLGRLEAAERWYEGDRGPEAPIARSAPARCGTCGFYLPLAGSLRAVFGVCGNEFAPDDAMVVAADHGCGAHSEALVEVPAAPDAGPPMDDAEVELVSVGAPEVAEDPDSESLGHS
jgi:hypothetical protein